MCFTFKRNRTNASADGFQRGCRTVNAGMVTWAASQRSGPQSLRAAMPGASQCGHRILLPSSVRELVLFSFCFKRCSFKPPSLTVACLLPGGASQSLVLQPLQCDRSHRHTVVIGDLKSQWTCQCRIL